MRYLFLFLFSLVLSSQEPKLIICLGDSHTTVEAGMGAALRDALGGRVEYEPVGINGGKAKDLLQQITTRQGVYYNSLSGKFPAMLLLAFGSNDTPSATYELVWRELVRRLKALHPNAVIIILGPPTIKKARLSSLLEVIKIQKSVALTTGLVFIDRSTLPADLKADGVHLTPQGYKKMGQLVALEISNICIRRTR